MKKILFLLSHQPNPRFIKQINYLSIRHKVWVVHFYRDYIKDLSSEYQDNCQENIEIGKIENGNFISRAFKLLLAIPTLNKAINGLKFDILVSENFDTLIFFKLASFFKKNKPKIVIEISDLLKHHSANKVQHRFLRAIEKVVFRSIDKLILTSDRFYSYHYFKVYKKNYFLLENKPLLNSLPSRINKFKNNKVVIGIVGLLLQGRPYKTLFDVIAGDDRFEVNIYGMGKFESLVEGYANKFTNIKYYGPYNLFKDSARIYASIDILYMPYDTNDFNVKLALPNKLYEAMFFKVPIITSKDTYLGEIVNYYRIGYCVRCCDKEDLLKILTNNDFKSLIKNFEQIDDQNFIADNDYKKLEKYILE